MTDLIRVKATWTDGTSWSRDYHKYILPDELANVFRLADLTRKGDAPLESFVVGSPEEVERMTAKSELGPEITDANCDAYAAMHPRHGGKRIGDPL